MAKCLFKGEALALSFSVSLDASLFKTRPRDDNETIRLSFRRYIFELLAGLAVGDCNV